MTKSIIIIIKKEYLNCFVFGSYFISETLRRNWPHNEQVNVKLQNFLIKHLLTQRNHANWSSQQYSPNAAL